jgi:hypothetical protein
MQFKRLLSFRGILFLAFVGLLLLTVPGLVTADSSSAKEALQTA